MPQNGDFIQGAVEPNKRAIYLLTVSLLTMILSIASLSSCDQGTKLPRGKKVIMVRAPQYYCDEELFHIRTLLQKNNISLVVTSTTNAEAVGERLGVKIRPDLVIQKVDIKEFDGVVIGSGRGCKEFLWQDKDLKEMVRVAQAQNKVLAAGCNAPVVLARAGVLRDKRATVFPNAENITELESAGAVYVNEPLIDEGKIITSRDLMALKDFARVIVEALLGR